MNRRSNDFGYTPFFFFFTSDEHEQIYILYVIERDNKKIEGTQTK